MKVRNLILTAGAVVVLAAPPAGAMIPGDGAHFGVAGPKLHIVKKKTTHKQLIKSSATSIKVGAYNAHAYVQGGASQPVAKAITKAGKRTYQTRPNRPLIIWIKTVPGNAQPAPETDPEMDCLAYNVCTDEQNCSIWGFNCNLVENLAKDSAVSTEATEAGAGTDQTGDAAAPAPSSDTTPTVSAPLDPNACLDYGICDSVTAGD
jgi:hypothetical protein